MSTPSPEPAALFTADRNEPRPADDAQQARTGLIGDFWGSFGNNFKTQANGAIQILDGAGVKINQAQMARVDDAAMGTREWCAEMAGQVAAVGLSYAVMRFGVGRLLKTAGAVNSEFTSHSLLKQSAISTGIGAFMGGVLTPADSVFDRLRNAGSGAVSTGIMGSGSALSRLYAGRIGTALSSPLVAGVMRNGFANNLVAGYVGGVGGELTDSALHWRAVDLQALNRRGVETAVMGVGAHGFDVAVSRAPSAAAAVHAKAAEYLGRLSAKQTAAEPMAFAFAGAANVPNVELVGRASDKIASAGILHSSTEIHPVWPNDQVVKAAEHQAQSRVNSPWLSTVGKLEPLPELKGDIDAHAVVVGSGVIGQQIAMRLASMGKRVVVLESDTVGSGTSSMMGAMNTIFPDPGFVPMSERLGAAKFGQVVRRMLAGRASVESLGRAYGDFRRVNTYNVAYAEQNPDMTAEVNLLKPYDPNIHIVRGKAAERLFPQARSAVVLPFEGNLNPYRMLNNMARSGHYQVFERSPALSVMHTADGVRVFTPQGSVRADKVILATNTPMTPFGHINEHMTPVQTFANVANIGRHMPGNYFDSPDQTHGKVPFSYWRQFNLPYFAPDATMIGSDAHFLSDGHAAPIGPRLAAITGDLFDGAKGYDPVTALIWTIYDSDRYTPGLPVYLSDPRYPALSGAFGGGGNGLNAGSMLSQAAAIDATGRRDEFLAH